MWLNIDQLWKKVQVSHSVDVKALKGKCSTDFFPWLGRPWGSKLPMGSRTGASLGFGVRVRLCKVWSQPFVFPGPIRVRSNWVELDQPISSHTQLTGKWDTGCMSQGWQYLNQARTAAAPDSSEKQFQDQYQVNFIKLRKNECKYPLNYNPASEKLDPSSLYMLGWSPLEQLKIRALVP